MGTIRSIGRYMDKSKGVFKGRGGLKGYRNHISRDRSIKNQRSPIQHGTDMLAGLFRQIFGARIRAARAK